MPNELLRAENLTKHFPVTKGLILMKTVGQVQAVDGIDFSINEGETLGLVGRVRLRQNHHLKTDSTAGTPDRRKNPSRRQGYSVPEWPGG